MMTEDDWERTGGVFCSKCGDETMRVIGGLCHRCWLRLDQEREEQAGRKREKRLLITAFNQGRINLCQLRNGRLY